jgi:hypothetical protein
VISPRSQLRLPATAAPNRIMQVIQDFGTSLFRIQKKSTPHFGVQTPYLAAVVKGTTFTVTVGPEGSSVQVTEGAVQVSTLDGGAAELLRPGGIASVGASDLFRLSVNGDTDKVVRSPKAPAAGGAEAKEIKGLKKAAYAGPRDDVRVGRAVAEKDKSLSELTKGLVHGRSSFDFAVNEHNDQARAAERAHRNPGGGQPDDVGKPDDKAKPEKPETGNGAEKPDDKPKDPEKPDGKPENPSKPDSKPENPEKPSEKPEKPGDKPETPEKPDDKPKDPDAPDGGDDGKDEDDGKGDGGGKGDKDGGKGDKDGGKGDDDDDDDDGDRDDDGDD